MHHTFHIYIVLIKLIFLKDFTKILPHTKFKARFYIFTPINIGQRGCGKLNSEKQTILSICDKFHVTFIRLWCDVQSSWICIRCDGFVLKTKLKWRYHRDHVTVSSWHFQDVVTVTCPLKRVRRCLSMKSIYIYISFNVSINDVDPKTSGVVSWRC